MKRARDNPKYKKISAFALSMPAIPDILHNTGDVFILTSLLTHCVLTKVCIILNEFSFKF